MKSCCVKELLYESCYALFGECLCFLFLILILVRIYLNFLIELLYLGHICYGLQIDKPYENIKFPKFLLQIRNHLSSSLKILAVDNTFFGGKLHFGFGGKLHFGSVSLFQNENRTLLWRREGRKETRAILAVFKKLRTMLTKVTLYWLISQQNSLSSFISFIH